MRAYQDNRRKFITDKLFSPVLQSQSSQGFEQVMSDTRTIKHQDAIANQGMPLDSVVQGGLRPRNNRTA